MRRTQTPPPENETERAPAAAPTVFVVDDDPAVRDSLTWLMKSVDLRVRTYDSALGFLEEYDPDAPGCLLLDIRMPGMGGLELQDELLRRDALLPVIFITAYGDVPTAVRTLKAGALDFVEKPFNSQLLLDRIQRAIALDTQKRAEQAELDDCKARLARLTPRERGVLDLMSAGHPSKLIAANMGVTEKTVEFHRANLKAKLGVDSLAGVLHIALRVQEPTQGPSTKDPRR
jgi:FixJ family two-component response regulator